MGKTIRNHPNFTTDKCARKNDKLDFKTRNGRQLHDDSIWGVDGKRSMKKSGRRAERRNINFEE